MAGQLSFDNPTFSKFALYSTLVLGKTMMMSHIVAFNRFRKEAWSTQEDVKLFGNKALKVNLSDETVERVRRCHLNDLENVFPFVLVGFFYVCTKPNAAHAELHFQIFLGARVLHTLSYLLALPQPCRGLCHAVGWFVTASMAVRVMEKILH